MKLDQLKDCKIRSGSPEKAARPQRPGVSIRSRPPSRPRFDWTKRTAIIVVPDAVLASDPHPESIHSPVSISSLSAWAIHHQMAHCSFVHLP